MKAMFEKYIADVFRVLRYSRHKDFIVEKRCQFLKTKSLKPPSELELGVLGAVS